MTIGFVQMAKGEKMLIHKTMKMPTSCLSCWIAPTCEVWVREKSKYKGYDNRLENCPLEPVKHGHWTIEDMVTYERSYGGTLYEPVYKCSCCGRVTESYVRGDEPIMPEDADFPKFCGNCGAKMDEVEEDG